MYQFNMFFQEAKKTLQSLQCPILAYDSVLEQVPDGNPFCTSAKKFERDLRSLQENGYTFFSMHDLYQCRKEKKILPEKSCGIAFVGGYQNAYEFAFPLLQKYRIPAAVFLEVPLVGKTEESGVNAGIRHFSWDLAREMLASGLVSFYPVWRPADPQDVRPNELQEQMQTIDAELVGNYAGEAVYCGNAADWVSKTLLNRKSELVVLLCSRLTLPAIQSGAAGVITVPLRQEVLDTLEVYRHCCESIVTKELESMQKPPAYPEPKPEVLRQSVFLPIDPEPRVRNYLRHAFPLSILQTKRMDRVDLLLSQFYIDVIYKPTYNWLDFHNDYYENWGMLTCRKITRDLLEANGIHVVEYLIRGMNLGFYGDIWLDTYYIPHKPGYGKIHMTHGLLVYGYDAQTQEFAAMSYDSSEHYRAVRVPVENLFLACTNRHFQYLNLVKSDEQYVLEYDAIGIRRSLRDYLESVCYDDNTRFSKKCEEQYYQYAASLKFQKLLIEKAEKNGSIHMTSMYGFSEQKQLMLWRVGYIARREGLHLPETESVASRFAHDARFVVNGSLKYNMTPDGNLLRQIERKVADLNQMEKLIIEELLHTWSV